MRITRAFLGSMAAVLALGTAGGARAETENAPADAGNASNPAPAPADLGPTAAGSATPSSAPMANPEEPHQHVVSPVFSTTAAFFPGVLVHGSGHLVAGDTKTGTRLLAMEGVGLGILAAGFVPIVLTGTARRLVGPAAALTVVGFGIFAISFLADVYGVAAPRGGFGAPAVVTPVIQTAIGYRYVYDPEFAYRQFMVEDIDYRTGHFRIHPTAWFALDDTNARLRGQFAYRIVGPMPQGMPIAGDGSFLDVEAALTRHSFKSDHFATTTGEMALAGRLDMDSIGPSLRGSFAEMSVGFALRASSYDVPGTTADLGELLLARFGYGMYLGRSGSPRGEVSLYYDHRHDDFAAGLKTGGLVSGVAGHFGAAAHLYVSDHWGLAAEAMVGSAYVGGLSVLFRHGDPL